MGTTGSKVDLRQHIKEQKENSNVRVYADVGVLPLEWPRDADGYPMVSDAKYNEQGKQIPGSKREVRNIETKAPDGSGIPGAPSLGFMELNPSDRSHPIEKDAEMIERVKDWLANSDDYRITRYNVSIEQGRTYMRPLGEHGDLWDRLDTQSLVNIATEMMTDDPERNFQLLVDFVGYEVNRPGGERTDLVDALNELASIAGSEDADAVPDDDSVDDYYLGGVFDQESS